MIGIKLEKTSLVLTRGRDFSWKFIHLDEEEEPTPFPAGELFFELHTTGGLTIWEFTIAGSEASLKVESEDVDLIPDRTLWQLVFLPDGEAAGGEPVAIGTVKLQGHR